MEKIEALARVDRERVQNARRDVLEISASLFSLAAADRQDGKDRATGCEASWNADVPANVDRRMSAFEFMMRSMFNRCNQDAIKMQCCERYGERLPYCTS